MGSHRSSQMMMPQFRKGFDRNLGWRIVNGIAFITLLIGCGGEGGGGTLNPVLAAPTITTQPLDATVNQGQTAYFTVSATGNPAPNFAWERSKDGGATWSSITGATSTSYSITTESTDHGSQFRAKASNSAGIATSQPALLNVRLLPVIQSFSATPTLIPIGGSAVLSWTVSGANSLSLAPGFGDVSGLTSKSVGPNVVTTYTLTATNPVGQVTASVNIVVDPAPFTITSFIANPAVVPFGGASTLAWSYTGLPLSLSLNDTAITGYFLSVNPVRRQKYSLAGSNGAGADSRTIEVAAQGLDLLAGNADGVGNIDGTAYDARFNVPRSVAVDGSGNILIADTYNHTIRKMTPAGVVSTLAGSAGHWGSDDGIGSAARFNYPEGIAVDRAGNVFVADSANRTIRKISPSGTVTTVAGNAGQMGFDDGQGSAARFDWPQGLTVDAAGFIYVADAFNHTIRKISPAGVVTTLAGNPGVSGSADGTGSSAKFNWPFGVTVDSAGTVYVADHRNNAIRRVSPTGIVTTLAGQLGVSGSADGTKTSALFNRPQGVAVDTSGIVFVADSGNATIRMISVAGEVSTLAGSTGETGSSDGIGSVARFRYPQGIAVDVARKIYLADSGSHTIRTVTTAGEVATVAGTAGQWGFADGNGSVARFNSPQGLTMDLDGNFYIADSYNHTIRKVTPAGVTTTLAGNPGFWGSADGIGKTARFNNPQAVSVDNAANVYVADTYNHTIRKITPAGVVTTLAGSPGVPGSDEGTGSAARFNYPRGVGVDNAGNVYVSDSGNDTIRKITPTGNVTTFAGSAGQSGSEDGHGSAARFSGPQGLTADRVGNFFVADSNNHTIRKVTSTGSVTTVAGSPDHRGFADGIGTAARFNHPQAVSVDDIANVYVADTYNHIIRKITPLGEVTTLAGILGQAGFKPGAMPGFLVYPSGIVITHQRDLVIVCNNGLVQVTAPGNP